MMSIWKESSKVNLQVEIQWLSSEGKKNKREILFRIIRQNLRRDK